VKDQVSIVLGSAALASCPAATVPHVKTLPGRYRQMRQYVSKYRRRSTGEPVVSFVGKVRARHFSGLYRCLVPVPPAEKEMGYPSIDYAT
jgi:hypothetical protein